LVCDKLFQNKQLIIDKQKASAAYRVGRHGLLQG